MGYDAGSFLAKFIIILMVVSVLSAIFFSNIIRKPEYRRRFCNSNIGNCSDEVLDMLDVEYEKVYINNEWKYLPIKKKMLDTAL